MKRARSPTPNDSPRARGRRREANEKTALTASFLRFSASVKNRSEKKGLPGRTMRFHATSRGPEDLVLVRLDGFCSHTSLCRDRLPALTSLTPPSPHFQPFFCRENDRNACSEFEWRDDKNAIGRDFPSDGRHCLCDLPAEG